MNGKYIMSLDQGTTSSRCIIYDRSGLQVSAAQQEFAQIYPQAGWVEHDPEEIWRTQISTAKKAAEKLPGGAGDILAIGITNQRETTIVWDRRTGKPVYNAIVWQCRRTAGFCDVLKAENLSGKWKEKTGLLIDPYFSATKIRWILDHVPGARKAAEEGHLLFGTVETWLIWNLTGGKTHVTDYSNASRTMLFNIRTLSWDEEILQRLEIPASMLPQPVPSCGICGETDEAVFGRRIPICGMAGDQQAALFGQTCFEAGEAKHTYGTGGFMLLNTGKDIVTSSNGLLSTIAWGIGKDVRYALEGSVFVCGAAIQWLRDELKLIGSAAETEEIARGVQDTAGVYLVPAFTGLGAPYWDPYARGVLTGLTRGAGRAHIVRAAVESMAYQTCDLLAAMKEDTGGEIRKIHVDGGAAANDFLLEFQADMLGQPVYRPASIETTSLGAAFLAGLAAGMWQDQDEIRASRLKDQEFLPEMDPARREKLLRGWHRAVERSLRWAEE